MNWKLETQPYTKTGESKKEAPIDNGIKEEPQDVNDIPEPKEIDTDTQYEYIEQEKPKGKKVEEVEEDETETTQYFNTIAFLAENDILKLDEDAEYEDSEEGLTQAMKDHFEKERIAYEESLGEEERELMEFLKNGGTAKDFLESRDDSDYEDIDMTDGQNQFNVVVEHLIAMGYEQEEAVDSARDHLAANTLEKQAKIAQKKLIELSSKTSAQKLESLKAAQEAKEKERIREQEDMKKTILSTRSLKGFELKEADSKALYDFITTPDKKGLTGLQKTNSEENKLAYAWLLMNGFNMDKIKKQIEADITKKVKVSLSAHRDVMTKPKAVTKQSEIDKGTSSLKLNWNLHKKNN